MRYRIAIAFLLAMIQGVTAKGQDKMPAPTWQGSVEVEKLPANQYVFLTPKRDEVVVALPAEENETSHRRSVIHVPLHNRQEPQISVDVARNDKTTGRYRYQYRVSNLPSARDPIGYIALVAPQDSTIALRQSSAETLPNAWVGYAAQVLIATQAALPGQPKGRYVYWLAERNEYEGIKPGAAVGGFEIESSYAPGFTTAFLSGREGLNLPQEWPSAVYSQLDFLNDPRWTKRVALTRGPMFAPTASRGEITSNFREGLSQAAKENLIRNNSQWLQGISAVLEEFDRGDSDLVPKVNALLNMSSTKEERQIATDLSIAMESRRQ
jgi:hypothetical protein